MSVEIAKEEDLERVIELGMRMPKESGFNLPEGVSEKVKENLPKLMKQHPTFVFKTDGVIIGVFSLIEAQYWWSDTPFLAEALFYVEKDERNKGAATALLKAAKEYAETKSLPLVVELLTKTDLDKKAKFLERLKFDKIGTIMGVNF